MIDESNLVPDTTIARAFADAELAKARALIRAQLREEALLLETDERIYNPRPYKNADPTPADWYSGTGIGALYGIDCEPLVELDGWVIGRE